MILQNILIQESPNFFLPCLLSLVCYEISGNDGDADEIYPMISFLIYASENN